MFSPIMIFAFYQWTLKDSWLSILLSVIAFLAIVGLVSYSALLTIRLALRSTPDALYADDDQLASRGPLYAQYRVPRYYFFLPITIASVIKALVVAFAKGNGEAQIIVLVTVEGLLVLSHFILRPTKTRGGDVFSSFLAIVRLVCMGLMIAFIERLGVAPIPRVIIGFVITVIFSVTVIITILNLVTHSGIERLWKWRSYRASELRGSAHDSILEKGDFGSPSSEKVGRPVNPTPEQNIPMDPHVLQPYPVSPTATEPPSVYSRDSGTITVGSLLPRRWSFSPLNSPTHSSQNHEPSSHNSNCTNTIRYSDAPQPQYSQQIQPIEQSFTPR